MAGNQLGKTRAGGAEWAMHLTGRYPDWWQGKVFDCPVRMWAAGVTGESTRDNPQRILIGPPQQQAAWGTGMIPADAILSTMAGRAPGALDSVVVAWGGGGDVQAGESVLSFKSYEKGREKWQGETLHGVWFDEEPPLDIYSEGLTRTNATGGITIVTFTPLLGMSDVVLLFLSAEQVGGMGGDDRAAKSRNSRSFARPSVLPDISPSSGEIGCRIGFRQSPMLVDKRDAEAAISPLEGEMSGRTEGGAVPPS
ncbi:terminase family protein [Mesorhizobium sp. M1027]|uniref:terminase large subunit domain-containing protein n=1 Tax=Mesorhizobium sp. M1027 TaxID=2957050 RepID=UPI003339485A